MENMVLPLLTMAFQPYIGNWVFLLAPAIYFLNKLENPFKSKKLSLTIYKHSKNGNYNVFFNYITIAVSFSINNINCYSEECEYLDKLYVSNNTTVRNLLPKKKLIENVECKINNVTVILRLKEDDKSSKEYYEIYGSHQKDIDDFVSYVHVLVKKYYKSTDKENKPKFYNYISDNWHYNQINVNKNFNNLYLNSADELNIKNAIYSLKNSDIYKKFGVPKKLGILLYGEPGTGKSSTIFAIADYLKVNIYNLSLKCSKKEFIEQILNIKNGSVICINDIDIIQNCNRRVEDSVESKMNFDLSLQDFLEVLDGYCFFRKCIIIMTTNFINKLDPALIRPGRIDLKIEYKKISEEQIIRILTASDLLDLKAYVKPGTITSAKLINNIIIPNFGNKKKIKEELLKL